MKSQETNFKVLLKKMSIYCICNYRHFFTDESFTKPCFACCTVCLVPLKILEHSCNTLTTGKIKIKIQIGGCPTSDGNTDLWPHQKRQLQSWSSRAHVVYCPLLLAISSVTDILLISTISAQIPAIKPLQSSLTVYS